MGILEDTVVKAKDAFDVAAKKTSEIISVQKLKVSAASLQSQIAKNYEALGRLVYDAKQNDCSDDEAIALLVSEIDDKRKELNEIEMELAAVKKMTVCPECSAVNAADASFCNKCGARFDDAQ